MTLKIDRHRSNLNPRRVPKPFVFSLIRCSLSWRSRAGNAPPRRPADRRRQAAPEATARASAPAAAEAPAPGADDPAVFLPSLVGPVGLYHMSTAEVGPAHHLRVALHGEYFKADSFLLSNDHDSMLAGQLTFGFTPNQYFEIFGGVLTTSNRNARDPNEAGPHRPRGDPHPRRSADRSQGGSAGRDRLRHRARGRAAIPGVGVEPVVLAELDVGLDRAAGHDRSAAARARAAALSLERQLLRGQLVERVQRPGRHHAVVAARVQVRVRDRSVAPALRGRYRCAAGEVDGAGAAAPVRRVPRGDHHRRRRSDAGECVRRGRIARPSVADVRVARKRLPRCHARRRCRPAVAERRAWRTSRRCRRTTSSSVCHIRWTSTRSASRWSSRR